MKKQLIEWGIIIIVFGGLYITGYLKDAAALLQRGILETRIFQPDTELDDNINADYNFLLTDEKGQRVSFTAFEDQVVFLNFWATWCPPCIAEMPDIHSLFQEMKADEISFVMVSLDDDFAKALEFKKRKGYEFPIYHLTSRRPPVFQRDAIPSTFVIDPQGKIKAEHAGMAKYNTDSFKEFLRKLKD